MGEPYDASKEDIYALGVVLYTMLTCTLPYDSPFYIENDAENPTKFGYLNGKKKFKIDLETFTDVKTGNKIDETHHIDPKFQCLMQNGIGYLLQSDCLLDYVSNESLDLLHEIFTKRMSLKELIKHPFVVKPPNPKLLMSIIRHVVDYKKVEYTKQANYISKATEQIDLLHQNRYHIQATSGMLLNKLQFKAQQQQQQILKKIKKKQENAMYPPNMQNLESLSPISTVSLSPTSSNESKESSDTSSAMTFSMNNLLTQSLESSAFPQSMDLEFSVEEDLNSPSPPPQCVYQYDPSPEIEWSPSPQYEQKFDFSKKAQESAKKAQESASNNNTTTDSNTITTEHTPRHTNLVHSFLLDHFDQAEDDNSNS